MKNQGQRMVGKANSKYKTLWQEESGLFKEKNGRCNQKFNEQVGN